MQANLLKAIENDVDLPSISNRIKELERDKILFTAELNKLSDNKIPVTPEMLKKFFLQYTAGTHEYAVKMKVLSLVSAVYLYDDKVIISTHERKISLNLSMFLRVACSTRLSCTFAPHSKKIEDVKGGRHSVKLT